MLQRARRTIALAFLALPCACSPEAPSGGEGLAGEVGLVYLDDPSPIVTPGHPGVVNVRPYFHDFGRVRLGTPLEHTFRLKNSSRRPIRIHDMLASCGCAVPSISALSPDGARVEAKPAAPGEEGPLLVLEPGATAEVQIRVDTSDEREANRDKLLVVRMRSDAPNLPFAKFELHVLPMRSFQVTPGTLELGRIPSSTGGRAEAIIAAADEGGQATVERVLSVEGPLEARLEPVEVLGRRGWRLVAEAEPGLAQGALQGAVHLACGGSAAGEPPLVVRVHGQVVPDVVLEPALFALTRAQDGLRAEARLIALVPGARLRVLGSRAEGEGAAELACELEPLEPDREGRAREWRVRLHAPLAAGEVALLGRIHLTTDDPVVPELSAPYLLRR